MIRLFRSNFRARLIALLAAAIAISQVIAVAIVVGDRALAEAFAFDSRIIAQTATAYGLAADAPFGSTLEPLQRLASREQQFAVQASAPALDDRWFKGNARLDAALRANLDGSGYGDVKTVSGSLTGPPPPNLIFPLPSRADRPPLGAFGRLPLAPRPDVRGMRPPLPDRPTGRFEPPQQGDWGYLLAAKLPNGEWLMSMVRRPPSIWPLFQRASLAALAIAVVVLGGAALMAGLIVRPISRLTAALSDFGRGESQREMSPEGPEDVRAAIVAFNTMSSNVSRIMSAQSRVLAAVGHDLRTPLTALRLKAESVSNDDLKQRMIEIIEEMQTLTQDVLTLARQATPLEESRTIELASLVDSLCQDLQDVGVEVKFDPSGPILWRGPSNSLRRALRNLIENAFQYGDIALVDVRKENATAIIEIDDDGPGVPSDQLENVLQPFVRLEQSRNRRTGGSGLGLPIAKTIIESLGGTLTLSNLRDGGLRASVELPLAS